LLRRYAPRNDVQRTDPYEWYQKGLTPLIDETERDSLVVKGSRTGSVSDYELKITTR
jgi:hypothetical protein